VRDVRRLDHQRRLQLQAGPGPGPEEANSVAEQDRHQVELHPVDEPGREVLAGDVAAAADADVLLAAASRACSSADSIPSVTKVKVVPPRISGSRS
jgi:hypothetical protein